MTDTDIATTETDVPPGEAPVACPYCGQPFRRESYRDLHVGLNHYERTTEGERDRFRTAYAAEEDDIRYFRLQTIAVLIILYFAMVFTYSIVT